MTKIATAAVAYEPHGELTHEEIELDDLESDEILVRMEACGICHTDSKFQGVLPLPGVFGHEGVGYIEEVGAGVKSLNVGDRVVMSYPHCTQCPCCIDAKPYECENIPALKFGGQRFNGSKTISLSGKKITSSFFQQSSFATYAITLEQSVVKVDKDTPAEMLAALPCGVQTGAGTILNTFKMAPNDSLIIFGAGAVGLSAVMAAKLCSAYPIICVDLNQERLELAKELGATHILNAKEVDVPAAVKAIDSHGMKFAFECSASVPGLKNAIDCIGQGGQIGLVSYPQGGKEFPFTTKDLFLKAGSITGIVQGSSTPKQFIPKLIELNRQGVFPYEKIISTYDFNNINEAIKDAHSGKAIKPVVLMK